MRGAVAFAVVTAAATLTGCGSDQVPLDSPTPAGPDLGLCRSLIEKLPDTVDDQQRRPVDPEDASGAAWGDPPIVLTCGGEVPAGLDEFASCQVANGVGWYVPDDQIGNEPVEVTMTVVEFRPVVTVQIPAAYWSAGAAAAMVDLGDVVRRELRRVGRCR
jgi:Protein of unknown function (DUF3515)